MTQEQKDRRDRLDRFVAAALTGIKANHELLRICAEAAANASQKQQWAVAQMAIADGEATLTELERREREEGR